MKSLKIISLTILIAVLFWSFAICQNIGTTGSTFLKIGAGARAIGMGSAFTGLSDDVTAIYWNPAGLGFTKRWELSFNYQMLFADFEYQAFFFSRQLRMLFSRKAALGVGVIHLGSMENWDSTNGDQPEISASDISDLAVIVPFAYRFDWLTPKIALGINYKYIKNKLADYTSHSHGLDFGLMFKTNVTSRLFWSLGTTLQNLTLKKVRFIEQAENLPSAFRAGTALKFYITNNQDITLAYDLSRPWDNNIKHNLGFEYWLHLGTHRFGFRGGYRFLDRDLGKLSFSVGYGLDITPMSQNSYFSQIDYALNNYNPDILGNVNIGSITLKSNNPEPFRRLAPVMDAQFLSKTEYKLSWEETFDYDDHDRVEYFVVVDTNFTKIEHLKNNAKKFIKKLSKGSSDLDVIFYRLTANTTTRFYFSEDADIQIFYWAVIAYDRNVNITIATGSEEIGRFTNKNLPDIKPISLSYTSAAQLDTSKYQGELEAKIVGLVKKPCKVVIYDSTDSKIICSEIISQLAAVDTFTFGGKWWATNLGKHKVCVIADFGNVIAERDENNNIFSKMYPTIPYGYISVLDTIKLEELSYDYIDLPTIPFIFFEPNSTEYSKNSLTNNEAAPDSLLKLFGTRLQRDYPGLKITIRGYSDPNSEAQTLGKNRLSYLRAEKIKQKLVEYGARESQILIFRDHIDTEPKVVQKSANLDPHEQEMVNEENRRAHIQLPDNLPVLKRVEYEKKFFAPRRIIRSKNEILSMKIQFDCLLNSSVPLNNLTILIKDNKQDPFPIKVMEVDTLKKDEHLNFTLYWDGIKDNDKLIAFNKDYYYEALVSDSTGKVYQAPLGKFYVDREVIVRQKRIFALAKFDKVAPLHEFYLEQLDQVEDMMRSDDRIRVRFYGHTDIIGTEERNNILSADRAMELASWLARLIDFDYSLTDSMKQQLKSRIDNPFLEGTPNFEERFEFGKGARQPLIAKNIEYGNNKSPNGRTLDRRVDIEIYRTDEFEKPPLIIEKNITFHPWYHRIDPRTFASGSNQEHKAESVILDPPEKLVNLKVDSTAVLDLLASSGAYLIYQNKQTVEFPDSIAIQTISTAVNYKLKTQTQSIESQIETEDEKPELVEIRASLLNKVTCIELQDSLLWMGTENGLVKWDVTKDTFQIIRLNLDKYRAITSLKYDTMENCLWVGTQKGLRQLVGDEWVADFNVGKGLSGNIINTIMVDKSGNLLLGTNEGINIYSNKGWRVFANIDSGLTNDRVNYIYEDKVGTLWACTNQGVCKLTTTDKWQPFERNKDLLSDTVRCMVIDSRGNKWFGTAKGVCKFDIKNRLRAFMASNTANKITKDEILCLVEDKSQILWCATEQGLSVYKDEIWHTYNYNDGLPANFVNTIFITDDNKKYVGINGGGISILRLP